MKYYTLAIREEGVWAPQHGDYSRSAVRDEMDEHSDRGVKSCDMRIVHSGETQEEIDAAILRLNQGLNP